jgi:hypothetical protein
VETTDMIGNAGNVSPRPSSVWGSRNAALVVLGFNVLVLGSLTCVTAAIDFVPPGVSEHLLDTSETLVHLASLGLWVGALGFLPWLKATYARAREVAPTPALEEQWRAGPIAGFFIPIVNLVRPYRAVHVLNEALDPDDVPAPAPRMAEAGATSREPAPVVVVERRRAKEAPVALWWSLWLGRLASSVVLNLSGSRSNVHVALHNLVVLSAATAAWVVVWRISRRLEEVERRRAALA